MTESHVQDIRQMGISHADFYRHLEQALGGNPYERYGNKVHVSLPAGTVKITLGAEKARKLSANVILPYADVTFDYYGVPDEVRATFERHFHKRFMRGLG